MYNQSEDFITDKDTLRLFKLCKFLVPFMYTNFALIMILSAFWAFYLIRELRRDHRVKKMKFKLRNTLPEYLWTSTMGNLRSNNIKNTFLLAICASEISITGMLIIDILYKTNLHCESDIRCNESNIQLSLELTNISPFSSYEMLRWSLLFRIFSTSITLAFYAMAFFIRRLTQYMVYQYSYFKPHLNLRFEIYMSVTCLFILFFMSVVLQLVIIYHICIVLLLIYEFTLLTVESRKLCLLLKQRLSDAILHENQNKSVIHYYKIGYKDYKNCSIVMLIALGAQYLGVSLYCINLIFMKYFHDYLMDDEKFLYTTRNGPLHIPNIFIPNIYVNAVDQILITFGTSIQILVYSIVTILRIFRYIKSRININGEITSSRSFIQSRIEQNNSAYWRARHRGIQHAI